MVKSALAVLVPAQLILLSACVVTLNFGLTAAPAQLTYTIVQFMTPISWICLILSLALSSIGLVYFPKLKAFSAVIVFLNLAVVPVLAQLPDVPTWDYFAHGAFSNAIIQSGHVSPSFAYAPWPGGNLIFVSLGEATGLPTLDSMIVSAAVLATLSTLSIYCIAKRFRISSPALVLVIWSSTLFLNAAVAGLDASPQLVGLTLFVLMVMVLAHGLETTNNKVVSLFLFSALLVSHPISSYAAFSTLFFWIMVSRTISFKVKLSSFMPFAVLEGCWSIFASLGIVGTTITSVFSVAFFSNLLFETPGVTPSALSISVTILAKFLSFYRASIVLAILALSIFGVAFNFRTIAVRRLLVVLIGILIGSLVLLSLPHLFLARLESTEAPFIATTTVIGFGTIARRFKSGKSIKVIRPLKLIAAASLGLVLLLTFTAIYTPAGNGTTGQFVRPSEVQMANYVRVYCSCAVSTDPITIDLYRYQIGTATDASTVWTGGGGPAGALLSFENGASLVLVNSLRLAYYAANPNGLASNLTLNHDLTYSSQYASIFSLQH